MGTTQGAKEALGFFVVNESSDKGMSFLSSLAERLSEMPADEKASKIMLMQLKSFTGAFLVAYNEYNEEKKVLISKHIEADPSVLQIAIKLAGKMVLNTVSPVSDEVYQMIMNNTIGLSHNFVDVSFGAITPLIDRALRATTGIDHFYGIAHSAEGKLIGTTILAFKKNHSLPELEILEFYAHLTSVFLSRKRAEDALLLKTEELQRFHKLTIDRELMMIELKKEVNNLLKESGKEEKYAIRE